MAQQSLLLQAVGARGTTHTATIKALAMRQNFQVHASKALRNVLVDYLGPLASVPQGAEAVVRLTAARGMQLPLMLEETFGHPSVSSMASEDQQHLIKALMEGYASLPFFISGIHSELLHVQLGRSGQARLHVSHKLPLFLWIYLILLVFFGYMELEDMLEGLLMSAHLLNLHVLTVKVNYSENAQRCNDAFAAHPWYLKASLIYLLWARFLPGGLGRGWLPGGLGHHVCTSASGAEPAETLHHPGRCHQSHPGCAGALLAAAAHPRQPGDHQEWPPLSPPG
jgi:hypothetical protein